MPIKLCKECGKSFDKSTTWQLFCNSLCRNSYHSRDRKIKSLKGKTIHFGSPGEFLCGKKSQAGSTKDKTLVSCIDCQSLLGGQKWGNIKESIAWETYGKVHIREKVKRKPLNAWEKGRKEARNKRRKVKTPQG